MIRGLIRERDPVPREGKCTEEFRASRSGNWRPECAGLFVFIVVQVRSLSYRLQNDRVPHNSRRTIKDSPDRAEASKAEATKLGIQVKELFYTPGGAHDAAIVIEAEGS